MVTLVGYQRIDVQTLNAIIKDNCGRNVLRSLVKAVSLKDYLLFLARCKHPNITESDVFKTEVCNKFLLTLTIVTDLVTIVELQQNTSADILVVDNKLTIVTASLAQLKELVVVGQENIQLSTIVEEIYDLMVKAGFKDLWYDYTKSTKNKLIKKT